MAFEFSPENQKKIREILSRYETRQAALLPVLHLAQEQNGHVSPEVEEAAARLLGLPLVKIREATSFYALYQDKPCGKIPVRVCRNLSCTLGGGKGILDYVKEKLGVDVGESTPDGRFRLESVECLCACEMAPVMQVGETYHGFLTKERIDRVLSAGGPESVPEEGSGSIALQSAVDPPLLSRNFHKKDAAKISVYLEGGGYRMAEKAVKTMTPEAVVEEVKNANLRGLGGAGFGTGMKWSFLPKDRKKPVYLVVNADEGEPGTFKDRYLLEKDPHRLIEGMLIAAFATGCRKAVVYLRGEYLKPARILQEAVREAYAKGCLGENLFGTLFSLDVIIHRGAGAYICGEETALLESLEGRKGFPRLKPPFPATVGLFDCPTVINNVETLSCIPLILEKGSKAFAALGCGKNGGTRLFSISGHVARPGLYEFPYGTTLRDAIFKHALGVRGGKALKAVIPGGLSSAVLRADEIDLSLDFESLQKIGSMLGSAGIIVMDEDACMVEALYVTARFFAHESCGQCSPCREGTGWYYKVIKRIYEGRGRMEDLDTLQHIAANMAGKTICAFADGAAMPFASYPVKFREEFEYHIREGKRNLQTKDLRPKTECTCENERVGVGE
ncbi:MAG: NADH-quinone oxidoreductase subunit NuoF [Candidatus Omnitrophota bacterium]